MASLTKEQTLLIRHAIAERGISTPDLETDLLDHVCSAVEMRMASGESFENAFQAVMNSFKENELKRVEVKTQALLAGEEVFYPDIKQSAAYMLLYVILVFLTGLLIGPIVNFNAAVLTPYIILIQTLQVSGCLLLTIVSARHALQERSFTKVDIFLRNPFPISIFAIIIPIIFLYSIWMEVFHSWIPLPDFIKAMIDSRLPYYSLPQLLLLSTLFPILSEVLFRGIILKGLLRKYTPLKAIFWSSLFFSISLLNPFNVLSLFAMGLFFGWLFYRTHSLIPSILAHILIQLPGVIYITWAKPQSHVQLLLWKNMIDNEVLYYCLGLVSLLITIFLIWRLKKMLNKQQPVIEFSME